MAPSVVPFRLAPREPGASPKTGIVAGIDTSSYQPTDLTGLITKWGIGHVVVKLYQSVENIGGRITGTQHSTAQLESAIAAGATPGGYIWGYRDRDPIASVEDGIALFRRVVGKSPPVLWIDIEPYGTNSNVPGAAWIQTALDHCGALGVRGGIYTGPWVMPIIGNPTFPGVLGWIATYTGVPSLDHALAGLTIVGHQYSSVAPDGTSLDMDVFDAAFVA